jgi:tetratricopeptide (TPR) repeat protein
VTSAEQALALVSDIGHASLEHEVLHSVASVYNLAGRHADALHLGQDGLALGRDLGVRELADWLGLLGDAYHGLGRYGEAAESLRSALPFYRDRFMRRHHALCLLKMGYACQAMGDNQAAISYLNQSLGIFEQLQLAHYTERARNALTACQTSQLVSSDQLPGG